MKRFVTILTLLAALTATAGAMSYEQARDQALFLTDKMAYELNLTEEQYDAAYEINLDYLMSVNTPDDLYEAYWRQRNLDLSYILLDWQYSAFCAATYFYRPLYWTGGVWHFAIYSRYPRRSFLYFGRPHIYVSYRGGHSWHHNGGRSWYRGRTFHHGNTAEWHGMRDSYRRGDFKGGSHNRGNSSFAGFRGNRNDKRPDSRQQRPKTDKKTTNSSFNGNRSNLRSHRESSTRTTVNQPNRNRNSAFRGNRNQTGTRMQRKPSSTFTPKRSTSRPSVNRSSGSRPQTGGAKRGTGAPKSSSRSSGSKGSGSFGGRR